MDPRVRSPATPLVVVAEGQQHAWCRRFVDGVHDHREVSRLHGEGIYPVQEPGIGLTGNLYHQYRRKPSQGPYFSRQRSLSLLQ